MNRKIALLLTGLLLGFSVWSSNSTPDINEYIKSNVQSKVDKEISKWDFSRVEKNYSMAFVSFRIDEKGNVSIENILTDNDQLKSVITKNFSGFHIGPDAHTGSVYYITVKFKRI
jgi:hypothetical protein